eukprot:UN15688
MSWNNAFQKSAIVVVDIVVYPKSGYFSSTTSTRPLHSICLTFNNMEALVTSPFISFAIF